MYEAEVTLARRAHATYREIISRSHTKEITTLKARGDFATETDEAVERAVAAILGESGLPIQGEEYSGSEVAPTRWIIDPVDGTFNYAVGIPVHGFTVCLVVENTPVVGIVDACGEATEAVIGQGTTRDGVPVHVSSSALADSAFMVGDITTADHSRYPNSLRIGVMGALADAVAKLRLVGSAAADLTWVAGGRAAGAILYSNNPWDMAAGVLAVQEAGGITRDIEGNAWSLESSSVLVSASESIADEVARLLSGAGIVQGL